jgi:Tfp pilus assembly protein PilO
VALANLKISGKSLVILIALAAMLLGCDLIVYVVSSGSVNKVKSDLSSREAQVENSKQTAKRLQTSQAKYEGVSGRLAVLERSVSKAEYVPTMLKQLESTGKSVKLDIVGIRPVAKPDEGPAKPAAGSDAAGSSASSTPAPAKKKEIKPYDTMLVDVQVQGSYWNTMRFLDQLTKFPKIVAVNSVQMAPNGDSLREVVEQSGKGRNRVSPSLTVTLNLCAFIFPADKVPTAAANPDTTASVTVSSAPAPPSRRFVRIGRKNWRSRHEAG